MLTIAFHNLNGIYCSTPLELFVLSGTEIKVYNGGVKIVQIGAEYQLYTGIKESTSLITVKEIP